MLHDSLRKRIRVELKDRKIIPETPPEMTVEEIEERMKRMTIIRSETVDQIFICSKTAEDTPFFIRAV